MSVFSKGKKSFFENFDTKNITDNKQFRKTVKPFLGNNTQKDEIISCSKDVAEIFNTYFVNAVSNLGIVINKSLLGNSVETNDPTVNIIESYKTRPSIRLIKELEAQFDNRFFLKRSLLKIFIMR